MAKEFPWPMKSDLCEDTTYPVSLSTVIHTLEESKYPALWIALQKTEDDKYFAILYHESWEETSSDGIKRVYLTERTIQKKKKKKMKLTALERMKNPFPSVCVLSDIIGMRFNVCIT